MRRKTKIVKINVAQYEPEGMYFLELYYGDKFIKKIAECYEEEYANLIAVKLLDGLE